jgi:hypothetical protein
MGSVAVRELARVGGDLFGDIVGRSMPYQADRVCRPETLTRLINDHALEALGGPAAITSVQRQDIPSVSSNCHNLVLTLEQAGSPRLPDSVFLKLPMEALATHWFFSVINSWRLESHFFRHVAGALPVRTPVTYATGWQGSRFFLLQENLHEDESVHLFTNPDMMAGPEAGQVRRCLDAFARLHSRHSDLDRSRQQQLLPLDYHPFLSPSMGIVSRMLNHLGLAPCMKRHPGVIPREVEEAYRLTLGHWDRMLERWFSGPLSLLHGDSHLGNFFVSGEQMGLLDWQAAHWGKGIRDVQYFLVNSLPADTLAGCERDLVAYYVERRGHHGAPLDLEDTWQDYRALSYHPLMTIVVSIGFGALNPAQDALMGEILRRSVAAVQRVDYAGWLRDYLASLRR